ncbi:hypothetical protein EJV47_05160 [Hymenobacter gummosus]|uniref:Uncharacterized protein n=1 Tax=Hymenobacter gummosus TaxID=1776032 RepID=A0A3S0JGH4_9BACT|nr:hypothetical protein [Hymenobacter gummosus]RTQ52405.1 hypothetical protein EJV47_05160 [Hymenobacter gummosus]
MGALLTDLLQRAQRSRRLVALKVGSDLLLGYVLSHNPDMLLVRTVTRQGVPSTVRSLHLHEVAQVYFDDKYVRLIEFKEQHPEIIFGAVPAPEGLGQQYLTVPALLQRALELRQLVQLLTSADNDPYGYVLRLTEDEVLLETYNDYGEPDGQVVLQIDDVSSVVWSDEDTRTIELLLRQRGAAAQE